MIHSMRSALLLFLVVFSVLTVSSQKLQYDERIGKEQAELIAQQMGIYENDSMTAYIRKIGNKLVDQLESKNFEYHFYLVTEPAPNAFAIPGGYIYITTGLIPILETEDELACIMAHEIIHSNNRHGVKQMRKGILPTILKIPGGILGVVNESLGSVFMAPGDLMIAGYSRKYETEADVEGVKLASKAGYDPRALKSALARLSKSIEAITGEAEKKSYFSDHPFTGDRLDNIEEESQSLPTSSSTNDASSYVPYFNGILYGVDPQYGIVKNQKILMPNLGVSMSFPGNWKAGITSHRAVTMSPHQDAAVAIAEEEEFASPKEAAEAFVKQIPPDYQSQMLRDSYKNGEVVVIKEQTPQGLVFAHMFWMQYGDKVAKVVGVSSRNEISIIKEQVDGIKELSPEEKKSITVRRMKSIYAQKGSSLGTIAKENENQLNEAYLQAINELKLEDVLEEDRWLKIVVKETFVK